MQNAEAGASMDDDDPFDLLADLDDLLSSSSDATSFWASLSSDEAKSPEVDSSVSTTPSELDIIDGNAEPKPKRKSSSVRQKEEMQLLRGEAEVLKSQLGALKRRRGYSAAQNSPSAGIAWREVAKRQLSERNKTEQENATLQSTPRRYLNLVRGVERLLGDPQVWAPLQENWNGDNAMHKEDMVVFSAMLRSIDNRYPQLDSFMGFAAELVGNAGSKDTFEIKKASLDGICFEMKSAKVIPFDFHAVAQRLWEVLRQGKANALEDRVVMASPEFVLSKLCAISPPVVVETSSAYHALKRFPGDQCECLMSEFSAMVPGSSVVKSPAFQLSSRSWGRLIPSKLQSSTVACVMEEFILTNVTFSNSADAADQQTDHCEIDILTRLLVTGYMEKRAAIGQVIENRLVDAAIAARMASIA